MKKFGDLDLDTQFDILIHMSMDEAVRTTWELNEKFRLEGALAYAHEPDRRKARILAGLIKKSKVIRPIVVDFLADDPWVEGWHRSVAADILRMSTLPAFVRVS